MENEKIFLTYNQQMRKLRDDKGIECKGSADKRILVKTGYFNLINGYKSPFVCGNDATGKRQYISGTSIDQLYAVKSFDDELRTVLLKYITDVEEEVRTLSGYKFDEYNDYGRIPWYHTDAFSPNCSLKEVMGTISKSYNELSASRLHYVRYYMDNHKHIPTWIVFKVVNFSTFINILNYSKKDVGHAICKLYDIMDNHGYPDIKVLIGSLHWMRNIRNACAHNERIYSLIDKDGRIKDRYFTSLGSNYTREKDKKLIDLLVYLKYYLQNRDYKKLMLKIKEMLKELQGDIHPHAFDYVRAQTGIKNINDIDILIKIPKDEINYNKFDKTI